MSPVPRTDATSLTTSSSVVTPASATKCTTRCSAWRLTTCARRVLPSPPAPTIDVTREVRSRFATAARSPARPSSGLGSCGIPCRTAGASPCSSCRCTAWSAGPGSLPSSSRSERRYASYLTSAADGPTVAASHRNSSSSTSSSRGRSATSSVSASTASARRPSRDSASARARSSDRCVDARSARSAANGSSSRVSALSAASYSARPAAACASATS